MRAWMQRWRTRSPARPTRPAARLRVESLEAREVPAVTTGVLQLSTVDGDNQFDTAVASSANGTAVAVWVHRFSGTDSDVRAQLYTAAGTKRGSEIVVASSTRLESSPTVAMDAAGNWKVAWVDQVSPDNQDIRLASFDSAGTRRRTDFTVAGTAKNEYDPSLAVDARGNLVLAYTRDASRTNPDVLAVRRTDAGTFQETIRVSTTGKRESQPSVARSQGADGRFAVAYVVDGDVRLKRYSAAGALLSSQALANGPNPQTHPSVAIDDIGRTVTAWQETVAGNTNILASRVTSAGGLNRTVTIAAAADQETLPAVAMDRSDADFVVAWQAGSSVYVREMNADSTPKRAAQLATGKGTAPAISISGADVYFLTFTSSFRTGDQGLGAYGRFGRLV